MSIKLDEKDIAILLLIQENSKLTANQIAKKTNTPITTIFAKTKRMEQLGTIATASAVCISGVIGWVGLVIPHISRMIVGPDYKKLIPVSILIGGIYLMIIDDVARTLIAGEIPLGILTALLGTPFFAYLLSKSKASWS